MQPIPCNAAPKALDVADKALDVRGGCEAARQHAGESPDIGRFHPSQWSTESPHWYDVRAAIDGTSEEGCNGPRVTLGALHLTLVA